MVKLPVEAVLPEAGAEPVPVQPVQTYWVPAPPLTGEDTEDDTDVPLSYQP